MMLSCRPDVVQGNGSLEVDASTRGVRYLYYHRSPEVFLVLQQAIHGAVVLLYISAHTNNTQRAESG